jgi:uncharacterized protein with HEPN domain
VRYELEPGRRPGWEIEQLADELAAVLGRPVDLVSPAAHSRTRSCPRHERCMQRELLLLEEMIDAAEQAHLLAVGQTAELASDRQRRDALLWNIAVFGEAAAQLPNELKANYPEIPWQQPSRLRNRIVHGYWSIAWTS